MQWLWIIGFLIVLIIGIGIFTDTFRLVKTIFLISGTSPYEQTGTGTQKLLILGDSTGYGTGVKDKKNSVAGRIGIDFPTVTITNNSVNGRRLDQLADQITSLDTSYDVILLQIGGNDILGKRPIADVVADLGRLYTVLAPKTKQIILMPAGNVGGAVAFIGTEKAVVYQQLSREYYAAFSAFADTHPNFTFVDLFEEPAVDPFVLHPELYVSIDGLHPNDAGYEYWYKTLRPSLVRYFGN